MSDPRPSADPAAGPDSATAARLKAPSAPAKKAKKTKPKHGLMRTKMILRVVSKALIPFILLFGLYVQLHGDYGPGGGFQAGVILASGLVLYGLIFNFSALEKVLKRRIVEQAIAVGVLLYGGVGVASMLYGGNFLDYGVFDPHDPEHGQHLGILLVELGVGITVTATMLAIFYAFALRERRTRRREKEMRRSLAAGQVATEPEA